MKINPVNKFVYSCVLVFFSYLAWLPLTEAAIEVYSGGKHFKSFDDYKRRQQDKLSDHMKLSGPIQDFRRAPFISPQVRQKLDRISYDKDVHHTVVDFQQNWQNPKPRFVMDAQEVAEALEKTMEGQSGAMLLISDPQKMRIMSLQVKEDRQSQ